MKKTINLGKIKDRLKENRSFNLINDICKKETDYKAGIAYITYHKKSTEVTIYLSTVRSCYEISENPTLSNYQEDQFYSEKLESKITEMDDKLEKAIIEEATNIGLIKREKGKSKSILPFRYDNTKYDITQK